MAIALEVVLVSGERRTVSLPVPAGSLANALARLDDWIPTDDGGWVQKSFIVEVRRVDQALADSGESAKDFESLSKAAGTLADQADE
jgi:hypothetical protein